jgi:hypothetical protein
MLKTFYGSFSSDSNWKFTRILRNVTVLIRNSFKSSLPDHFLKFLLSNFIGQLLGKSGFLFQQIEYFNIELFIVHTFNVSLLQMKVWAVNDDPVKL